MGHQKIKKLKNLLFWEIKENFALSHQLHEGLSGSLEQLEQRYFAKLHNPHALQVPKIFRAWTFPGFDIGPLQDGPPSVLAILHEKPSKISGSW